MLATKLIDSKRTMKLAVATVVILALLVTVTFVYSRSRNTEFNSDRSKRNIKEDKDFVNKIKRSPDDDRVYGPSGLESDVDDTRDTDVHDRRELLGEAESEVDCIDGYPCRQKRSDIKDDMPEIVTLPNTKTQQNDKNENAATEKHVDENSETHGGSDNEEEDEDDGIEYDGDEPLAITKRSYMTEYDLEDLENGEYQDSDEHEDFAEKYKRETNGDDAKVEVIRDTDDNETGNDDEDDENIEEDENDDEGTEDNDDEKTRRDAEGSFNHIEDNHGESSHGASTVSDQLEDEMYNPPYNLVSSDGHRRKRRSPPDYDDEEESKNEDTDNDEGDASESDEENSITKRELDEIDNDSYDENDDEEGDVDDDIETEYNKQRYKRDNEENDDEIEDEDGDDDGKADDGSDDETEDRADDMSETNSIDDKDQQKRTTEDKTSDIGDGDFQPISSIRKIRGLEYPDEPESGDMAYDEVDTDPNSGYSQWEHWGPCSVTCGVGRSVRRRTCNDERYCQSGDYEERVCLPTDCENDDNKK